jgi:hypothetical protein
MKINYKEKQLILNKLMIIPVQYNSETNKMNNQGSNMIIVQAICLRTSMI